MTLALLDRLTGEIATPGPGPALLGRYVLAGDTDALINGIEASGYDPLVPDSRAGWRTGDEQSGRFEARHLPTERQREELGLVVGDARRRRVRPGAEPVMLAIEEPDADRLGRRERLDSLEHRLPCLERVLCNPECDISEREVLLRASRARRPAPGAVEHLARHPEDWSRLVFGRPVPERLLAIETFDDLDIYENRLALHARDAIEETLRRERTDRRDNARLLGDVADRLGDARNHRVRHRLARLLGTGESASAAAEADAAAAVARREAERIDAFAVQVQALDTAPLSVAITAPERRRVADFHLVNRLAVHIDYREVGILFSQWVAGRTSTDAAGEDPDGGWRRAIERYDAYAALLVCTALRRLGLVAAADGELRRGAPPLTFALRRRSDVAGRRRAVRARATPAVQVAWAPDGTLRIDRVLVAAGPGVPAEVSEPVLRIVALADRGVGEAVVREQLAAATPDLARDARLCVLTPAGDDAAVAPPVPLSTQGPWLVTASPRAMDGAEQLMRLLRTLLWEPACAGFPHAAEVDAAAATRLLQRCPGWLRRVDGTPSGRARMRVRVCGPMPLGVEGLAAIVREAVDGAHESWRERERAASAAEILEAILRSRAWHAWSATCPLCGDDGDRDDLGNAFFRHRCPSCDCVWQPLDCDCGRRTAIVAPPDATGWLPGQAPALDGDLVAHPVVVGDETRWLCDGCAARREAVTG